MPEAVAVVDPNELFAPIFFFGLACLIIGLGWGWSHGYRAGARAERAEQKFRSISTDKDPS